MNNAARHSDRSARGIPRLRSGQAARSGGICSNTQGNPKQRAEQTVQNAADSSTTLHSARNDALREWRMESGKLKMGWRQNQKLEIKNKL